MKTATMFANGIKYNTKTEKAHSMAFEGGGLRSWEAEPLLFYDK
jgi:hypothetical protein